MDDLLSAFYKTLFSLSITFSTHITVNYLAECLIRPPQSNELAL